MPFLAEALRCPIKELLRIELARVPAFPRLPSHAETLRAGNTSYQTLFMILLPFCSTSRETAEETLLELFHSLQMPRHEQLAPQDLGHSRKRRGKGRSWDLKGPGDPIELRHEGEQSSRQRLSLQIWVVGLWQEFHGQDHPAALISPNHSHRIVGPLILFSLVGVGT